MPRKLFLPPQKGETIPTIASEIARTVVYSSSRGVPRRLQRGSPAIPRNSEIRVRTRICWRAGWWLLHRERVERDLAGGTTIAQRVIRDFCRGAAIMPPPLLPSESPASGYIYRRTTARMQLPDSGNRGVYEDARQLSPDAKDQTVKFPRRDAVFRPLRAAAPKGCWKGDTKSRVTPYGAAHLHHLVYLLWRALASQDPACNTAALPVTMHTRAHVYFAMALIFFSSPFVALSPRHLYKRYIYMLSRVISSYLAPDRDKTFCRAVSLLRCC